MAETLYEKQTWEDLPSETTPISAERLNHIEDGIYRASVGANEIATEETAGKVKPDGTTITIDEDGTIKATGGSTGDEYAKKSIYGDTHISLGRKEDTTVGNMSRAIGYDTTASGDYSSADGYKSVASGMAAHAEGNGTDSSSYFTHAEGIQTVASQTAAHAEGSNTTASGGCSHAEGYGTTASGADSHAEGSDTVASGDYSHAEGYGTVASADYQHVCGKYNEEVESAVVIVGWGSDDSTRSNIYKLDQSGSAEFAGTITCTGNVYAKSGSSTVDLQSAYGMANGALQAVSSLSAKVPFPFGIDDDGNYGYYKDGEENLTPFASDVTEMTYDETLEELNSTDEEAV